MPRIQPGPRKGRSKAGSDAPPGTWEGRLRLWIDVGGHNALGPGKVRLLEAIATTRSLSAAARKLRLLEEHTGLTVVEPQRGGRDGGGTDLTPEGRALLEAYHNFRREVEEHLASACRRHFARWSRPRRRTDESRP